MRLNLGYVKNESAGRRTAKRIEPYVVSVISSFDSSRLTLLPGRL